MIPNPEDPCCPIPDCLLESFVRSGNGTFDKVKNSNSHFDVGSHTHKNENNLWDIHQTDQRMANNTDWLKFANSSQIERDSHLNTLIPGTDETFAHDRLLNSSQVVGGISNHGDHTIDQATSRVDGEGFVLPPSVEFHKEDGSHMFQTHPHSNQDINFTKNHNSQLHVENHGGLFNGSSGNPFLIFGSSLNSSDDASHSGLLFDPADKDENELSMTSDHEQNSSLHSHRFGQDHSMQVNRGAPEKPLFHGGLLSDISLSPNQKSYIQNTSDGSIIKNAGNDDIFYLPEEDESFNHWEHHEHSTHSTHEGNSHGGQRSDTPFYLPEEDEGLNLWEQSRHGTHPSVSPSTEASFVNEHETSDKPYGNEDTFFIPEDDETFNHWEHMDQNTHHPHDPHFPVNGSPHMPPHSERPPHFLSHDKSPHLQSQDEELPYLPFNTEESHYLPTPGKEPSYLPTSDAEPPYPLPENEGAMPGLAGNLPVPSTHEKHFHSTKSSGKSTRLPLNIPPSSHNEADVSSHIKGILVLWKKGLYQLSPVLFD